MTLKRTYMAVAVSWAIGCDGVGRGLVDTTTAAPRREADLTCRDTPTCAGPAAAWVSPRANLREFPELCQLAPSRTIEPDRLLAGSSCECERWRIELGDRQDPAILRDLTMKDCTLEIAATRPAGIRLEKLQADSLSLMLDGPVELTIADQTSLDSTSVSATSTGTPAHLALVEVAAQDLDVAGVDANLVRTSLQRSRVQATSLTMESVLLEDVMLESGSLVGIDARFHTVEIATELGSLSGSGGSHLVLSNCDAFLIADSELEQSQLHACQTVLRLYDSTIDSSVLNGAVESDGSDIRGTRLGLGGAARLTAWATAIFGTVFCSETAALRLGSATIKCSACEGQLDAPDGDVCSQGGASSAALSKNECESLQAVQECTSPFPRRGRP